MVSYYIYYTLLIHRYQTETLKLIITHSLGNMGLMYLVEFKDILIIQVMHQAILWNIIMKL